MGFAEIEKKILDSARAEAQKILKEAQVKASKIKAEGKLTAQNSYDELIRAAHKKADDIKRSLLTPARLVAKKDLLSVKQEIMDEVFKGIPQKIREEKEIEVAEILYG